MTRLRRFFAATIIGAVVAGGCSRTTDAPQVAEAAAIAGSSEPVESNDPPAPKMEAGTVPSGNGFPFPDDAGGKALAQTLQPGVPAPLSATSPAAPRERRLPENLDSPGPTQPKLTVPVPRLALEPRAALRPAAMPERLPRDFGRALPDLPPRGELPTGALVRQIGPDVSNPVELPILSQRPVPDRAPLSDPTLDFTAASVISPTLPLRATPAGFIRIVVPDPFEHSDAARARTPVVEDPNRVLGNVPPPRR